MIELSSQAKQRDTGKRIANDLQCTPLLVFRVRSILPTLGCGNHAPESGAIQSRALVRIHAANDCGACHRAMRQGDCALDGPEAGLSCAYDDCRPEASLAFKSLYRWDACRLAHQQEPFQWPVGRLARRCGLGTCRAGDSCQASAPEASYSPEGGLAPPRLQTRHDLHDDEQDDQANHGAQIESNRADAG